MKECSKCRNCYTDDVETCPLDSNFLTFTISGDTTVSGRYLLECRLGQGGMGIVFKAKHKFLKSSHAIKIILPSLVDDDKSLLVRFRQEAVLAASIDHPNVIRVTDFGVENDIMPYLVMEFVDGVPLSFYLLEGKPLPLNEAYGFFLPAARGVGEAHRKGIVHRDLKPQNIMVQKNLALNKAIKVLDFGLAKIKSADSYPSLIQAKTLSILGSPPYMSPEQWSGEDIDHRTDIYALAVLFFQMLTGSLPFQAETMPAMMYQHLTVPPPSGASLGTPLSADIEAVIRKALEKEPGNRYDSLDVMLTELGQAVAKSDTSDLSFANTEYLITTTPSGTRIPKPVDTAAQLSNSQKERFYSYFDSLDKPGLLADGQLAQEFLDAQDRAEKAKTQAVNADLLVQELVEAQKQAEEAQEKALQAKQRIEADVRRQVEAEMERLVVEGQANREAEAQRLAEEVDARKKAEDRANYLAQAALEAQQLAENERKKREEQAQQRELHQGARRQAEVAAQQLSEQVADAKKKYEEAKNEAAREAHFRMEAEAKRQKIESELQAVAENEAEHRKLIEAEAKKQIEEQAGRFEKEALAAQQRLEEARLLTDLEAQKREEAEAARIHAEEEARRLAQEIIEVQRQMEEMQQHITADSHSRKANLQSFDSSESLTVDRFSNRSSSHRSNPGVPMQDTISGLVQPTHGQSGQSSKEIPFSLLNTGQLSTKRTFMTPVAIGLMTIILIAGGGIGVYFLFIPGPNDTFVEQGEVNNSTENPKTENPSSPALREMVLIQGGSFQMGRSDIPDKGDEIWGNQYPDHSVPVKQFHIDKTETTNEQYADFVSAKGHTAPMNWNNRKPPTGREQFPVTDVSWSDAQAYADWISQRDNKKCSLPTEEQWEFAARNGAQQTSFPWGNVWRDNSANLSGRVAAVGTSRDQTLVGGVEDMLGNVSEWTSSRFALYPGHDGNRSQDNIYISVRGLNWYTPTNLLKKPNWLLTFRNPALEDDKNPYLGFRLVCEP